MAVKKQKRNQRNQPNRRSKWRALYKRYEALIAALLATGVLLVVALVIGGNIGAGGSVPRGETETPAAEDAETPTPETAEGGAVIALNGGRAKINGDGARYEQGSVYIDRGGSYELSGELADGSIVVDAGSDAEVLLSLRGVEVYCADDACLRVENAGAVRLSLGPETENRMESGGLTSEAALADEVGGTIFARGDLTVEGEGKLEIVSNDKHGVDARGGLAISSGEVSVIAPEDGLRVGESFRMDQSAGLVISAGDDGVRSGTEAYIAGGDLAVSTCRKGIEAQRVEIAGGSVALCPTEDGIRAAGGADGETYIRISDGKVLILGEDTQNADGLDSDGSIYVTGGKTFVGMAQGNGNAAIHCAGGSDAVEISGGFVIPLNGVSMMAAGQSLFPDVEGRWMEPGADFVALHGIFKGGADGNFAPEGTMTRSALASALYNFAHEQGNEYDASGFTDVEDFRWYANAAGWAKQAGVLDAKPDGSFGANDAVTREDAALALYRYAEYSGADTAARADLSQFPDKSAISGAASDAMSWAVKKELFTGKKDGSLDPAGILTRAEMAKIFLQFVATVASA